ncbi:MAG: hypothetical protein LBH17_02430 [Oscillospiraceae bacterium]|nr:hypothetical protein [Oscillospiraceae bacterium]
MDLRTLLLSGFPYAPPRSYELPAVVRFAFDGGIKDEIVFPINTNESFYSAKIADTVYFVSRAAENGKRFDYAIDTSTGLVTRISGDAADSEFNFGVIEGSATSERHASSNDLDGNKVKWTFGPGEQNSLTAEYSGGSGTLTYHDGTSKTPQAFAVARIAQGVYFYYEAFGEHRVTMLCDFGKDLAVGSVLGAGGVAFLGGWGKIL